VAMDPISSKKALRTMLQQRLAEVDAAELLRRSAAACALLTATPEYQAASTLMFYLPLRHEVDTRHLALHGWQDQKFLTVPLVSYEQKHMIPIELRSLDDAMESDHYGVRTPRGQPQPVESIDLVVVPGLGFDRHGYRIGRGMGLYDRFLARKGFRGKTCGLCLEEQVVDAVPTGEHDVRLNMLVTDRGVIRFDE
jgi:5-formyltetrahydrofolate cyclo-ligase